MTLKERYSGVIDYFQKNMPVAETELRYTNAFELVVAVILSAQCTDKRVNMIVPALMERYPTPEAMSQATPEEIFTYIKSCSYPNNKAKHLAAMARKVVSDFSGRIPETVEELMTLPGVGRKTANVVLGAAFGKPGIVVDTHVARISQRLGLTDQKDPTRIEFDLMDVIPRRQWNDFSLWLIYLGRSICTARKPDCGNCMLNHLCEYPKKSKI